MRKTLLLLTPLLLAGCVKQSATYYANEARDQLITVRAEQEYFWDKKITLTLVTGHLPDCQRAIPMSKVPMVRAATRWLGTGIEERNSGERRVILS